MNESPSTPEPSLTELPNQPGELTWPNGPAKPGVYYSVPDPARPKDQLVVMLMETFQMFGTELQQYKQTCKKQDARIKELLAAQALLAQQATDARDRLDALRERERSRVRRQFDEQGLVLPDDPKFNTQRK